MSRYFPAAGSDFLLLYPSACVNPSPPGGWGVPLESSGDKAFARVFSGVKPLWLCLLVRYLSDVIHYIQSRTDRNSPLHCCEMNLLAIIWMSHNDIVLICYDIL